MASCSTNAITSWLSTKWSNAATEIPGRASDVKDSLTKWKQCSVCEEAWTLVEMYHV